jgi:hypothetical protein
MAGGVGIAGGEGMSMTVDWEGTVVDDVGVTADVVVSVEVDVSPLLPPHAANGGPATTIVTRTLAIPLR